MKSNPAATPQETEFRQSKDEMNLVEHPFALLRRSKPGEIIHLEFEKVHPKTGKTIQAEWRVSGDSELGMPGPVEERLFLVLMELTREQGWPVNVGFSRNDLLKRLGLTRTKGNYNTLAEGFRRLVGVRIDAKRSFWDAKSQNFAANVMFAMLDEVRIIDEGAGVRVGQIPLALSSFRWSDVLYQSFLAGNVRSLDIVFALSLESRVAGRLFRYLDKHKHAGPTTRLKYEIELHRLCEIHLGMKKSKYASKLKERLAPAHDELMRRGFLSGVEYAPMKSQPGAEKVVYFFSTKQVIPVPEKTVIPPLVTLMASMDVSDEERRHEACDAVFTALPQAERDEQLAKFAATLPAFMRPSEAGFKIGIARQSRAYVWDSYRGKVMQQMEKAAQESS